MRLDCLDCENCDLWLEDVALDGVVLCVGSDVTSDELDAVVGADTARV